MAQIRWYLNNSLLDGWQLVDQSAATAATCNCGWVVGTGSTFSSELQANTERASTTFVANTVPDGTLDTTLKDAFRSQFAWTGSFAAGNWTFQFAVQSTVQGGAADGQIVFRILKANADGSSATEITSAQQSTTIATNVSTTDVNITATWAAPAWTITNQYIFVQLAWKRTGAGGMTTTNIRLRTGSSTTVGTTGLTGDFTPGDQAVTGAHRATTIVVNAAHTVTPAQSVTGTTLASTAVVSVGTVSTPAGGGDWGSAPVFGFSEHSFSGGSYTPSSFNSLGANTLWVLARGGSITGITDNQGNTYTLVRDQPDVFSTSGVFRFYVATDITASATHTVTLTMGDGNRDVAILGFAGGAVSTIIDQQTGVGVAFRTSEAVGSITPTADNCLVLAAIGTANYASIDSSYTIGTGTPVLEAAIAYKLQSAATTANPTVTLSAETTHFITAHVSFLPGAGGAGGDKAVTGAHLASTAVVRAGIVGTPPTGTGVVTKDTGFPVTARNAVEGVYPTQTWPAFSTPGPNRMVVAMFLGNGGIASPINTLTSANLTWTRQVDVVDADNNFRVELWTAWAATAVTAEVITNDFTGTAYYARRSWLIFSFEGSSAAGVGSVNEDATLTGDPSITLDALTGSYLLAGFPYRLGGATDTAPDANTTHEYTGDVTVTTFGFNERAGSQVPTSDGTFTLGWVGTDIDLNDAVIGAIEIQAVPVAGGSPQTVYGVTLDGSTGDVLLEDGSGLLLEDGSALLLEPRVGLAVVYPPSLSDVTAVSGAHLASTAIVRVGSVTPGAVSLTGATLAAAAAVVFAGVVTTTTFVGGTSVLSTAVVTPGSVTTTTLVSGAHVASTAVVTPGRVATLLAGAHVASTAVVRPGTVASAVTGAHVASTAQVFAGGLAPVGAHLPSTAQVFAGSVIGEGGLAGAALPSTAQLFPGSVATGAVTVTGATVPSSLQVFAGTVTTTTLVTGAHRTSTTAPFPGSISVNVGGATLLSTATVTPGSVTVGAVTLVGAHLASSATLYPGSTLAVSSVSGAHRPSTAVVFPGTCAGFTLSGATVPSTAAVFPGSVATVAFVGGAHQPSTATLFPGSILTITGVGGATLPSTAQLFLGRVGLLIGAHVPSTVVLQVGAITPVTFVTGAHLATAVQLFPGRVRQKPTGAALLCASAFSPGSDHWTPASPTTRRRR